MFDHPMGGAMFLLDLTASFVKQFDCILGEVQWLPRLRYNMELADDVTIFIRNKPHSLNDLSVLFIVFCDE